MPEDPALPSGLDPAVLMPKAMLKDPVMTSRIDVVRGRMGLPLLDDASREQLWNTVFAASEDLINAVAFVRAAYGLRAPVKAVISLSGGLGGFDLRKTASPGMPPGLFVIGQNDLEGVLVGTRGVLGILAAAGVKTESAWMPGFAHFYPMGATSLGNDISKLTLEARVLRFLERNLGVSRYAL